MHIDMFFMPESEITAEIIKSIGRRRAKRLRQAAAAQAESEPSETDDLFHVVVDALENKTEDPVRDDWSDRRWLSDIVYHFMGRLAGFRERGGPSEYELTPTFVAGMRTRLGLLEPEDMPLLYALAQEFSTWLSKRKEVPYPAGWGLLVGSNKDPEKLTFKPLLAIAANRRAAAARTIGDTFSRDADYAFAEPIAAESETGRD